MMKIRRRSTKTRRGAGLTAAGVALVSALSAGTAPAVSNYTALDLLSPCQEADNDSRWGAAAETECEQYILGFVDALDLNGVGPPAVNTADEVRWAFMRWVHADYAKRTVLSAAEALMTTLKEMFACP